MTEPCTGLEPKLLFWPQVGMVVLSFLVRLLIRVLETVMLWCCGRAFPSKTLNLFNSTPLGFTAQGALITEGSRGEGGYLANSPKVNGLWNATPRLPKTWRLAMWSAAL